MKAFFFFFFCSCEVLIKICSHILFISALLNVFFFIAVEILILSTVSITAGDEARFLLLHQFWWNIFAQPSVLYFCWERCCCLSWMHSSSWTFVFVRLYLFFFPPRCHWEVLLWLLFSFQVASFRFREWSSLHSLQWFSPRRCKLLKLVHLILLKLTRINRLPHNDRLCCVCWTSASYCFDKTDLCSVKAPGTDSEDSQDSSDSGVSAQKTREILARRPSYR